MREPTPATMHISSRAASPMISPNSRCKVAINDSEAIASAQRENATAGDTVYAN